MPGVENYYEFGDIAIDLRNFRVLKAGDPVTIEPRAFDVLRFLLENRGRVVEKQEIFDAVWKDVSVGDNALTRAVKEIRHALGDDVSNPRFIETVPKRGYRFIGAIHETKNVTAPTAPAAALSVDKGQKSGFPRFRARIMVPLLATIFILSLALWYFSGQKKRNETSGQPIVAIAILPLENLTGDPGNDYLSDGLSESLIDRLSRLPQLKVIARSSSFKFRGQNINTQDIAKALGVQAMVMGRIAQRGESLTIRIELVNTEENRQVWSEQYIRNPAEVFALQQEIGRTVSEKLRLRLSAGETQQITRNEDVKPEAYNLLLKARFMYAKGPTGDKKKAVEYYQQAIAIDPNFALAYAELSLSYRNLVGSAIYDPQNGIPQASEWARRAIELDENLAEGHQALAQIKRFTWEWQEAESQFHRAIELNPNFARAHTGYSIFLSNMGRHEQAISESNRALELDPVNLAVKTYLARALILARRYDEAVQVLKEVLELKNDFPTAHLYLGGVYALRSMYTEGIAEIQEAIRLGDESPNSQIDLGAVYAKAGENEKARAILEQLQTNGKYVSPGSLATLYTALGEKEQAFRSLEKAYSERDPVLQELRVEPAYDELHDDPRFKDLLSRIGLPL